MANKKHIRLNSVRDIKKLMAKMINERRRGEIKSPECRDVGYLAKILLDAIKTGELEERMDQIEERLKSINRA